MNNDFLNAYYTDGFSVCPELVHNAYLLADKDGKGPEFLVEMICGAPEAARKCEARGYNKYYFVKSLITDVMFKIGVFTPFDPIKHEQTK